MSSLLDGINSPAELRTIPREQLGTLAEEIRDVTPIMAWANDNRTLFYVK